VHALQQNATAAQTIKKHKENGRKETATARRVCVQIKKERQKQRE
jgi:hypothetical protein